MHAQLEAIGRDFESAQNRLHLLASEVPFEIWPRRPHANGWSIAECVAHLNLTSTAYLPLLRDAIARARSAGGAAPRTFHRDLAGWLLWKSAGPPVRLRTKTTPPFVPAAHDPPAKLVADFDRLQAEQIAFLRESDGLPIDRVKVTSPFNARLRYNLYACLTILPQHQHRHLWQAEQVWRTLRPSAAL